MGPLSTVRGVPGPGNKGHHGAEPAPQPPPAPSPGEPWLTMDEREGGEGRWGPWPLRQPWQTDADAWERPHSPAGERTQTVSENEARTPSQQPLRRPIRGRVQALSLLSWLVGPIWMDTVSTRGACLLPRNLLVVQGPKGLWRVLWGCTCLWATLHSTAPSTCPGAVEGLRGQTGQRWG